MALWYILGITNLRNNEMSPLVKMLNAFHAAGECRRHVQNCTTNVKNVKIVELYYQIWIHHEKCIQISTNMPGIGSLIREIAVEISEM